MAAKIQIFLIPFDRYPSAWNSFLLFQDCRHKNKVALKTFNFAYARTNVHYVNKFFRKKFLGYLARSGSIKALKDVQDLDRQTNRQTDMPRTIAHLYFGKCAYFIYYLHDFHHFTLDNQVCNSFKYWRKSIYLNK